jgi:predicted transcriptional regulator of viral defense system
VLPKPETTEKALNIFRGHDNLLRTSQAIELGIAPRTLYAMHDAGLLVKITRGVFRLAEAAPLSDADLIQVALRIQKGVICLISALAYHNLTTQIPHQIYVAIPLHAEKPRLKYPPVRLFWFSRSVYSAGIDKHLIDGTPVSMYNREKTIADCFKYRNKIGLDISIEALKEGLDRGCKIALIMKYARIDRVENVIRPYMEALT